MTPQALAQVHAAAFAHQRPWSAAEFADLLTAPHVFLITDNNTGFALGRLIADEVELLTLAVAPALQRQGAGRALLDRFERRAASDGAVTAHLEVASDNVAGLALYASGGYTESGRRVGYYRRKTGPPCDAVMMTKTLT